MQILKALFFVLAVLVVLLAGIFALGIFNFRGALPAPKDAFKNKEPDRAAFYIKSIQNELKRITDAAKLFK